MTVEEIFTKISAHMIKGIMFHEQMSNYYDFLNLRGYKRCHEYHYICETVEYRKLQRYYINCYNKLIPDSDIGNTSIIPTNWSRYTRQEVDGSTKRNAVKSGISEWIKWERETRDLYADMYKELEKMNEVSAAAYICKLVCKVEKEIKHAERKGIDLETVDYDMSVIVFAQKKMHDKYLHKLRKMEIDV